MDHTKQKQTIAYFSMEIGLASGLPTYSGGLGVLAGDTIRAAADLNVPLVAMTLLHRKGYFHQRLDASGWQSEEPVEWVVEDFLAEVPPRVAVGHGNLRFVAQAATRFPSISSMQTCRKTPTTIAR